MLRQQLQSIRWVIHTSSAGTSSAQATFPVSAGPDLLYNGGLNDAFVAKLNPAGNTLAYIGYIGGASSDEATAVAVDNTGSAYVTGNTFLGSNDLSVVVGTPPDIHPQRRCLRRQGQRRWYALEYCGYIGGCGRDFGNGIAVDSAKGAYVVGATDSNESSFPVSVVLGSTTPVRSTLLLPRSMLPERVRVLRLHRR
jgi:hypothetical protein